MKKGAPEPIRALNQVPVIEQAGELPLVDLRKTVPRARIMLAHVVPYVRPKVAIMLDTAIGALPPDWTLVVNEAWRPVSRQKELYDTYSEQLRNERPDWSYRTLRRQTNRFFAPYDQKAPPGHSTGGAIDVGIIDAHDQPIDLVSPLDGWEAAYTYHAGLSEEAQRNRERLVSAMLGAGFSNCRDEFWHYSYGDAAWAVRTGSPVCFYDRVDLPDEFWKPAGESG